MRKAKRVLVALILFTLVATLLGGCGGSNSNTTTGTSTAGTASAGTTATEPATTEVGPPMEISFAMWEIGASFPEGNSDAVYDLIKQKFNVTIKPVKVTWDDSSQKIQLWAASDQLPDMFAEAIMGTQNFKKWIDQGLVKKLPDDLSAYPNLAKLLENPGLAPWKYPMGAADGKWYCMPRINYLDNSLGVLDRAIVYRKDWMEAAGVTKEPENVDELIAMLKAIQQKDPGGNGVGNTVGITGWSALHLYSNLMLAFDGVASGNWVRDKSNPGKYIDVALTPEAKTGVLALKKMWDAGVVDKDIATLKAEEGQDKFASGKAAAYAYAAYPLILSRVAEKFNKNFPDKKFADSVAIMKQFKAADGNYYKNLSSLAWSETYINSKVDDKKMDRILQLMDYFYSPEGIRLVYYGLEGIDYKMDGDKIVILRPKKDDGTFAPLSEKYPFVASMAYVAAWSGVGDFTNPQYPDYVLSMSNDMLKWINENAIWPDTDPLIEYIDYPSKGKFSEITSQDNITKAIMSKDAGTTWDELNAQDKKNGVDKATEEINAEAAKLGIK